MFLDALASLGSMLESQSVSQSFMFLRFCQILGISSGYLQSVFRVCSKCVQSVFKVCSKCVQSAFRVRSGCVQSAFRVHSECIQSAFKVGSEIVQSVFRVFSILKSFHHLAHLVCQFLAFFSIRT